MKDERVLAIREGWKFAGNDYLGLASHASVLEALGVAAAKYGISSTSSRWAQGWTQVHADLEQALADWMGTEDACIIGAAYFGGVIYYEQMAALGRKVVFCDEMVHANQYLGMRAAGLDVRKFRHLDAGSLREMVTGYSGPPAIVATDGVYGISGEVAPLAELAEIARGIGAEFFVDDAHGVGVMGAHGRGAAEFAGLSPDTATVLGSMSKAMGTGGGFLAGRGELVERFRRSTAASGSGCPPPPIAGASLSAVHIIRNDPEPRRLMEANADRMRAALAAKGIALVNDTHPIVCMQLSDEHEAVALDRHFEANGISIPYFKYASEPRQNLLRAAARAVYTDEQLARFEKAVREF